MGLRRTPPPGVSSQPRVIDFPSEFPSSPPAPVAGPARSPSPPKPPPKLPSPKLPSPKLPSSKLASPKLPSPKLPSPGPPSPKLPRITPRNSLFPTEDTDETPHAGLVNLARIVNRNPTTPQRPTTGGAAVSHRRSVRRTPGAGRLNPLPVKLTARSPHASRAFETRRAATPGRERRKSGRYPTARETPRDLLRALSRQLAPATAPYQPTPVPTPRHASYNRERRASDILFYSDPGHDDEDPNTLPPAPRFSMSLEELNRSDDEDDLRGMQEPRFSVPLEDLDNTQHSIEFPRRAASEQPWGGRGSFGIRLSDRFTDFQTIGSEGDGIPEPGDETVGEVSAMIGDESVAGAELDSENDEVGLTDEGDGDVTARSEIQLNVEEDSFYMGMPAADNESEDEDEDEAGAGLGFDMGADSDIDSAGESSNRAKPAFEIKPLAPQPKVASKRPAKNKKVLALSRHGHPIPEFSRATIKKMAQRFSGGATLSKETMDALAEATAAYFEQAGEDLGVYAHHAGRKTIEDADAVQLFKRQRRITPQTTLFSLAQTHLPGELLHLVRMPVAEGPKRKRARLEAVEEEEEEE